MNPKKAFRKFMLHIGSAPDGAHFETGISFDDRKGWRIYQRCAGKGLLMGSKEARSLAATFEKTAVSPEWRGSAVVEEMRGHFEMLRSLADEADQKNAAKVRPPEMPVVSPFEGTA